MGGCDECGAYDLDWWTEENDDGDEVLIVLCEVCGWSEEEAIEQPA